MIDCKIEKCLQLSLVILLAMLCLFGIDSLGFAIPVLRQLVGFVLLTFIPGILIVRILKIHNLSTLEHLIYSVGLSITFVMVVGLSANFILPHLGVPNPISEWPMIATISIAILILCGIAYWRDRNWNELPGTANRFHLRDVISPPYLLLILLPLVAILGALLVNYYQENLVIMGFIILVAIIIVLAAFDRSPQKAYPLAIAAIAIGLLLHTTLASSQLTGFDIHGEYRYQDIVAQSGYWDYTTPGTLNTALSVVMLCPIYSLFLNIDAAWIFKIVYPLLFSLVPLTLFHIYREQIGAKKAFFSALFFMSVLTFFTEMTALARQEIAEIFFALLIVLMIDRKLTLSQRTILFITFAVSLIASHYALGYLTFGFLLGSFILIILMRSRVNVIWGWLTSRFGGLPHDSTTDGAFHARAMLIIIAVYILFGMSWYGMIAGGEVLQAGTKITQGKYMLLSSEPPQSTTVEFIGLTDRDALVSTAIGLDFFSVSTLGKSFRIFQYMTQIFLIIGFISMILKPKRFKVEFIALAAVAAFILFGCLALPRVSSFLNLSRFYHISLFLVAPLCILGAETAWRGLTRSFKSILTSRKTQMPVPANGAASNSNYIKIFALVVLIPYFLFNTGFFFEITHSEAVGINDSPSSQSLSSYRVDMGVFSQQDVEAAIHLSHILDDNDVVYADKYSKALLAERLVRGKIGTITASNDIPENAHIFLRTWNVSKQEIAVSIKHGYQKKTDYFSLGDISASLENRGLIYNNDSAQILAPKNVPLSIE